MSEGFKMLGAKVPLGLYADVEKAANLLDMGLSDVVRNGVMVYLEMHGISQGIRIDREATQEAHRRLRSYEEKAADLMPVVAAPAAALKELRRAAKDLRAPTYRTETMRELAKAKAEEVAVAVRMWRNPDTRGIITNAASLEPTLPEGHRGRVGPPILHPLRNHLGSYAALRDALADETGVQA